MTRTAVVIVGTRPEAIKLAPVYKALELSDLKPRLWISGQHREMLAQALSVFHLTPHKDFQVMTPHQGLGALSAAVLTSVEAALKEERPEVVVVQGDTTTAFAAALAAFYQKIPVAHVEAGLRTGNMHSPFPEEMNRTVISKLASFHFAPTAWAKENLLREGIDQRSLWVTGNTVIDALDMVVHEVRKAPPQVDPRLLAPGRKVLITGHRRENFGEGIKNLCRAIATLAEEFPDIQFIYPVHLNPQVQAPVYALLGSIENVLLIPPLEYKSFVWLMDEAHLIITDSGGIQEEAPHLGKPVLVTRDTTERPEGVDVGTCLLVGTDYERIVDESRRLLTDTTCWKTMSETQNPYGDGKAGQRIAFLLERAILGEASLQQSENILEEAEWNASAVAGR